VTQFKHKNGPTLNSQFFFKVNGAARDTDNNKLNTEEKPTKDQGYDLGLNGREYFKHRGRMKFLGIRQW
jgi:hypothetical protein